MYVKGKSKRNYRISSVFFFNVVFTEFNHSQKCLKKKKENVKTWMMDEKVNYTETEEEKTYKKTQLSLCRRCGLFNFFSFVLIDTFQGGRISQSVRYGERVVNI